ncbi:glycoside hydrolase family 95 protein [Pleomassaria siparia CBS 279.74]|uniref:Glycoside hydrolase family 95 protein n=1 Tax=Pleomassaria siparia CBS 279.74 TaxID=1314801 RepID=A0A6G1KAH4_9PLEO|nr:glycoside hydrolase family 95 protein [Pleomassaria siparia CBS 279.74]
MYTLLFFILATLTIAKDLWSSIPVTNYSNIIRETYLLGNGKLGAMPFGAPGEEKIVLNIDSLWAGGPFSANNYTGGNPTDERYPHLPKIREWIFQNTTGNVTQLLGNGDNYGTYQVMGNLSISHNVSVNPTSYERRLNLTSGVYYTKYSDLAGSKYTTAVFCSYPDQVCIYHLSSSATLPDISIKLENQLVNDTLIQSSCGDGYVRLRGITQVGPPDGMRYEGMARVTRSSSLSLKCCERQPGTLIVLSTSGQRSVTVVVGAGTNYDQTKGNARDDFSFRGEDPETYIQNIAQGAASRDFQDLHDSHIADYQTLAGTFTLELPDPRDSSKEETSLLFDRYRSSQGDPFVESLLFDYSRHLLISSSRQNSLPANLQGRWNSELDAAWSADYHANINIQMNYWGAEQTGLGDIQDGLWRYMQDTWVTRGSETARLLYGAPGWVTHSEMNIFGHTGMKNDAQWANYPASAAWMMQHVADHFAYSQDVAWLLTAGYPLLKGVVQFWLSQLQEDGYWNDGTLVVNPCNSPEHGPTTFGCTHYQQVLHQMFANALTLGPIASESDFAFLQNISTSLDRLDKGLRFTSWGGLQEWKLPEEQMYDEENNTHRHLSQLWGWYPGVSLVSPSHHFLSGYTNVTIQDAVATSLYSRGTGNGPDANAGWAKVWRSACWARLNNTERAYFELRYAVEQNFVGNGLSMYSGKNPPFQIDANLGFSGAVLSMLVVDIEAVVSGQVRNVVLGPAIPKSWGRGMVKGLRLRGGGIVGFEWNNDGLVTTVANDVEGVRLLDKSGKALFGR